MNKNKRDLKAMVQESDERRGEKEEEEIRHVWTTPAGRKVSYCYISPSDRSRETTAVIYMGPISSCSLVLQSWKETLRRHHYSDNCAFVSVDRPDCGDTDTPPASISSVKVVPMSTTRDLKGQDEASGSPWCCGEPTVGAKPTDVDFCEEQRSSEAKDDGDKNQVVNNGTTVQICQTEEQDVALVRIETHVQDVLHVLERHQIHNVYILAACLGHVFAVALCNRIHAQVTSRNDAIGKTLSIQGLTLVAPFVSTVCPDAWKIARLGASVPSIVLYGSTEALLSIGNYLQGWFITPRRLQKMISKEEQDEFGFTLEELDEICKLALQSSNYTKASKGPEARLGSDPVWQRICDDFARIYGKGPNLDQHPTGHSVTAGKGGKKIADNLTAPFPISIHASSHDKLATIASVEWVAYRCYSDCTIVRHDNIRSHELMTVMAGPPSNPTLLLRILDDWNLGMIDETKGRD